MVIGTLALLFWFFVIYSFLERLVSRAAAPEGRCSIQCRGYLVHLSVHPLHSIGYRPSGAAAQKGVYPFRLS